VKCNDFFRTLSLFYDHLSTHYYDAHHGGVALKIFSAFAYALALWSIISAMV